MSEPIPFPVPITPPPVPEPAPAPATPATIDEWMLAEQKRLTDDANTAIKPLSDFIAECQRIGGLSPFCQQESNRILGWMATFLSQGINQGTLERANALKLQLSAVTPVVPEAPQG